MHVGLGEVRAAFALRGAAEFGYREQEFAEDVDKRERLFRIAGQGGGRVLDMAMRG